MIKPAKLIVGLTTKFGTPMIMGVPTATGYDVYLRIYTNTRGRGGAWTRINEDETATFAASKVTDKDIPRSAISQIIEVPITNKDLAKANIGQITSINVKAMKLLSKYPASASQSVLGGGYNYDLQEAFTIHFNTPTLEAQPVERVPMTENIKAESTAAFVLASVPESTWADTYINRVITDGLTEFNIYDVALLKHENILITGPAGSGKTMSVLAYAAARGLRYYNVSSHNGVEPTQLFGRWVPTASGSFRWQDGPVTDLVKHGGVLLINEVNFMPERTKTVLFSLLDKRREIQLMDKDGEMIKAHPNLLIISDMNPGYRGTKPLNEAEKDRYAHKLDFPYDTSIEEKLITSKVLRSLAEALRKSHDREELSTPISTRSLVAFTENARDLGLNYAIYSFLNGFVDVERGGVKLVLDTYSYQLESDFDLNPNIALQPDEQEGLGSFNEAMNKMFSQLDDDVSEAQL
jgi:nitric oxide reductase NorQ protein